MIKNITIDNSLYILILKVSCFDLKDIDYVWEVFSMRGWNPFAKVDMEIGSFLKASPFNKEYKPKEQVEDTDNEDCKSQRLKHNCPEDH